MFFALQSQHWLQLIGSNTCYNVDGSVSTVSVSQTQKKKGAFLYSMLYERSITVC